MSPDSPINPIIPGFAPDPSLILVDDTYFLVNSTFHLFPGLPIYTSRDLVHWHQIGNAINRPSQLSFSKASTLIHDIGNNDHLYATGGLYAPTLRHHNGTFYIVCTNVVNHSPDSAQESETKNFIISTTDIYASAWSDPVYFDFHGIDPSLFFDPHTGKAYLCGSKSPGPSTKITLFEIDVTTGEKLTEEKYLWHGTGGIYPEGPHIYFHNGFYYLMIAEGGTHEGHAVTMARSNNLLDGPWDPSPLNPILTAANTDEYVQCTGHCEAFAAKDGQWWGVCLGIRMREKQFYGLGRETFLTRGSWSADGWLKFERATMQLSIPSVSVGAEKKKLSAVPGVDYVYIHDPVLRDYDFDPTGRNVVVRASPHDLTAPNASPSFLGKRQRWIEGKSRATLVVSSSVHEDARVTAGLAVFKDEHRFFSVSYSPTQSPPKLVLRILNTAKKIDQNHTFDLPIRPESLEFIVEYTEMQYEISYRLDAVGESNKVASVDAKDLSGKDFVGPIFGVFAIGHQKTEVKFEWFEVDSA
ncbi:glycosyl hydrolase [Bipolaris maydis]|nr:glycoside hydrolase family 43 protein [Bipolaris maydis]KAJ5030391.1 glycoside hydrolase [Bipolaris maydis]KAJ6200613.1 glycosyl hydrolase [Bipolaris maydis]KAJ6285951.1 glycoside hydrolase [Bipolaris maydis]